MATRDMSTVNKIVVHHSYTNQPDPNKIIASFNDNHKRRLHPKPNGYGLHIAYHYVIMPDGEVLKTRPLTEIGYHAGDRPANKTSIGICLEGNFDKVKPTKEQYSALGKLIGEIQKGLGTMTIHGHNEFDPRKTCPGANFDFSKIEYEKKGLTSKEKKYLKAVMKLNSMTYDLIDDAELREELHEVNNFLRDKYGL